jgi:hypothetical protein
MNNAIQKQMINDFREAMQAGMDGIVRAGEIYVKAIDEDPRNADKFREEFADWVPASAWAQLEAVGRKWLHPRLLMGGVSDRRKSSLIKRLPYSLQSRVFSRERFPLLLPGGDVLNVDLLDATASQAEQLCNGEHIRNVGEQKAWMHARENQTQAIPAEPVEAMPYCIMDGKVSFRRGCILNRSEIKRLLQEM